MTDAIEGEWFVELEFKPTIVLSDDEIAGLVMGDIEYDVTFEGDMPCQART